MGLPIVKMVKMNGTVRVCAKLANSHVPSTKIQVGVYVYVLTKNMCVMDAMIAPAEMTRKIVQYLRSVIPDQNANSFV